MNTVRKLTTGAVVVIGIVAALGSETVDVKPMPTSGSRADGTVDLSFEYHRFDTIHIDEGHALTKAKTTCANWGYSGAQPFGGNRRECLDPPDCYRYRVTTTYQCTGPIGSGL